MKVCSFISMFHRSNSSFLDRSLNQLDHLHIWHDNSGEGASASWFLKCLIVKDLQTQEIFYFIAQRWFAVEKDDGKVTLLPPLSLSLSSSTSKLFRLND